MDIQVVKMLVTIGFAIAVPGCTLYLFFYGRKEWNDRESRYDYLWRK